MLGWTALALAKKAVVPIFTLEWIEGDGKITSSDRKSLAAIQETLVDGGIEFLSGGAPGVRLHRKNGSETGHHEAARLHRGSRRRGGVAAGWSRAGHDAASRSNVT